VGLKGVINSKSFSIAVASGADYNEVNALINKLTSNNIPYNIICPSWVKAYK